MALERSPSPTGTPKRGELMSVCCDTVDRTLSMEKSQAAAVGGELCLRPSPRAPTRRRKIASDEARLVALLQDGDQTALETIFNMYAAKLYNVAHRIVGEAADTEEVIQDVFWTVYRKAKSFQGNSQFSTWLYKLTVNAALGKIRRSKKNKEVKYE